MCILQAQQTCFSLIKHSEPIIHRIWNPYCLCPYFVFLLSFVSAFLTSNSCHTVWNQYQDCLLVCTNWFTCRPHLKNVWNSDFLLAGSKASSPITTSSCYVLLFLQVSGMAGMEKQTHILMNTKWFFPVITYLVYFPPWFRSKTKSIYTSSLPLFILL